LVYFPVVLSKEVSVGRDEPIVLRYLACVAGTNGMASIVLQSSDVGTGGSSVHVVVSNRLSHRGPE
jgi:hypothetical protein